MSNWSMKVDEEVTLEYYDRRPDGQPQLLSIVVLGQQIAYIEMSPEANWTSVGAWIRDLMFRVGQLLDAMEAGRRFSGYLEILLFLREMFPTVYEGLTITAPAMPGAAAPTVETGRFTGSGGSGGLQNRFEIQEDRRQEAEDTRTFESREDYLENG